MMIQTLRAAAIAVFPLWDAPDDAGPTLLVWTNPADIQALSWTELAGGRVEDLDRLTVPALVQGERYPKLRRIEVLLLAARFELDVRFGYRSARGNESVKLVRALSGKERLLYGAKIELLDEVPRGAKVPNSALRSYRYDRVLWAEIPLDQERLVRWHDGAGYFLEAT